MLKILGTELFVSLFLNFYFCMFISLNSDVAYRLLVKEALHGKHQC
ncbi:hypothetical protein ENHYDAX1_160064 [Enhydrobacter sp. AX1]|nr:hypothetical protein ENHYDAX1_160064 [Enhydrobacter sp. AX1]